MIILMDPTIFTSSKTEYFLNVIIKTNTKGYVNISWSISLELWVIGFQWWLLEPVPDANILTSFTMSPKSPFNIFLNLESQFYHLSSLFIVPEQGIRMSCLISVYTSLWYMLHERQDFSQFCLLIHKQNLGHWSIFRVQSIFFDLSLSCVKVQEFRLCKVPVNFKFVS